MFGTRFGWLAGPETDVLGVKWIVAFGNPQFVRGLRSKYCTCMVRSLSPVACRLWRWVVSLRLSPLASISAARIMSP